MLTINLGVSPAKINYLDERYQLSGCQSEMKRFLFFLVVIVIALPSLTVSRTEYWLTTKHRRRRWLGGSETEQSKERQFHFLRRTGEES